MEWQADGVVVGLSPYGEDSLVCSVLTEQKGRWSGHLQRGRSSARLRSVAQLGNRVCARWSARLEQSLGAFRCELIHTNLGIILNSRLKLAALHTLMDLVGFLPERQPYPAIYRALVFLLDQLIEEDALWPALLVHFELGLLEHLGFGLSLSSCGVTGDSQDLAYISPRSGRAVCSTVGFPWRDRLLVFPNMFRKHQEQRVPSWKDIREGLAVTGYFLSRHVFEPRRRQEPLSRSRFLYFLEKEGG